MEQKQKPIILEIEEARQELVQCVNDILTKHKLSCYLIEPMFAELYTEIKAGARNEIAQARAQVQMENGTQVQEGKEGAE
jgi:hypothetical protein